MEARLSADSKKLIQCLKQAESDLEVYESQLRGWAWKQAYYSEQARRLKKEIADLKAHIQQLEEQA